jgi:hypothetical protein
MHVRRQSVVNATINSLSARGRANMASTPTPLPPRILYAKLRPSAPQVELMTTPIDQRVRVMTSFTHQHIEARHDQYFDGQRISFFSRFVRVKNDFVDDFEIHSVKLMPDVSQTSMALSRC